MERSGKSIEIKNSIPSPKLFTSKSKRCKNQRNTLEKTLFKLKEKKEKQKKFLNGAKQSPQNECLRKREIMENMDESEWIYLRIF